MAGRGSGGSSGRSSGSSGGSRSAASRTTRSASSAPGRKSTTKSRSRTGVQKSTKPSKKTRTTKLVKGDALTTGKSTVVVKKGDTVSEIAYKLAKERNIPFKEMYKAVYEANSKLLGDRTQLFNKYGAKMRLHGKLGDFKFRDAIKPGDVLNLPTLGLKPENPNGDKPGKGDQPNNGDKPSNDKPSNGDQPSNGDKPDNGNKPDIAQPDNGKPEIIPEKPNNGNTPDSGNIPPHRGIPPIIDVTPKIPISYPKNPTPIKPLPINNNGKKVALRHARLRGRGVFIKVNVNINGQPNKLD